MSDKSQPARRTPKWKVYFSLGRVSNLPTVWSNCLAGFILAGAAPTFLTLLPLLAAISLFYTGGMFLNDAFDQNFDREYRPERPIPTGIISLKEVLIAGFAQLVMGEMLLFLPSILQHRPLQPQPLMGGVVLGLLIVYYNYRHKTDPLSPLVMALCRVMVYFIAASTAASAFQTPVYGGVLVLLGYLIGLTYIAKQENLQEVKNLWPLLFLLAPFVYGFPVLAQINLFSLFYLAFLAWVVFALSFLVRKEGKSIPRAVISLIAGISLLDGLLIAGASGGMVWVGLAAGGFLLTLVLQRFVAGT